MSPTTDRAVSEIEGRARFDQIRYAQVWEDADVLVAALRIQPGDTVVSIASAGDNAIALLAQGAERVIAADLNPTQLFCVRLRVGAYRTLSHQELLELMGSRPSARRSELLGRVARTLGTDDQAFWAARRDGVERHGVGGVGKFEDYFRLFRTRLLPLVHGRNTVEGLLAPRDPAARAALYDRRWNNLRWRMLLKTFFSRTVMGRLGRDPAFFDHAEGSASDQVARNTRQALVDQDPSNNPYLTWILTGTHGSALPLALRPEHFDVIRERIDRLEIRLSTIEALAEQGVRADAFNLSDIFEYMSPPAHEAAYRTVLDCARPGARIAYWNMMAPRRAPASLLDRITPDRALEASLRPVDKAFFYGDFVVETVR
jgi:S-adenosylmethionine-diacylglycerol 3-amino-3-carboxypropyl transferase